MASSRSCVRGPPTPTPNAMSTLEQTSAATPEPVRPWFRWALLGLLVVGLALAYTLLPLKEWLTEIARALRGLGPIAFALYVATYVVASLLILPAVLLSIGAGFAWGALGGFAIAVPAATLAATCAFLVSRFFFSGRFRSWLLHRPRLHAVERAVNEKGAPLVFLLRLSPMLPFPVLNYIFGLTLIPYRAFALATFIGMMPITFMWTYVGSLGAELGGLDGDTPGKLGAAKIGFGVVGGLVTLAVSIWVGRAARKALREAAEHEAAEQRAASEASAP